MPFGDNNSPFYEKVVKKCKNLENYIKLEAKSCPSGMQNQASLIFKIALNRVLTLAFDRARRVMPESSGIIDLQNNRVCKQFKH